MTAKQIHSLEKQLDDFLNKFSECFGRCEMRTHLSQYVRGQLAQLHRKTIESLAEHAHIPPRTLQQFLAQRRQWEHTQMCDCLQRIVASNHDHPHSIGLFDETSIPKKGNKTPGVQRQWCGYNGKVENCVTSVHLGYVAGDFHCLLDHEVYLPKSWHEDRNRCRAAGIPDDVEYRPKWQIALTQRDRAVENGVQLQWIGGDEGYGRIPQLHTALSDRSQRYVFEVPRNFYGYCALPKVLQRHLSEPIASDKLPEHEPLQVKTVETLFHQSPAFCHQRWEDFHIKDSVNGPVLWQAKCACFFFNCDGQLSNAHWLIVARNALDHDEVKFFVSNGPAGTPLEVLLHVAFNRWHIERCFEDEKQQLGLDHYEVRTWTGVHRHLIITAVSHLFLADQLQKRGKKRAIVDDLSAA